jgi:hypothetical protein
MTTSAEAAEPQPAWEHPNPLLSIRLLFAEPYWVSNDQRQRINQSR